MYKQFIYVLSTNFLCFGFLCSEQPTQVSNNSDTKLLKETIQLIDEKKYDVALEQYEQLIKDNPNNVDYLLKAGKYYKDKGLNQKARETYLRALSLQPKNPDVNVALGFIYLSNNNLEDGKKSFQTALDNFPQYADALAGMGRISALKNNPTEAEQYYFKALKVEPNNITALEYLAALRMQQKHYQEAGKLYEKLTSLDPKNADFKKYLEKIQNKEYIHLLEKNGHDNEVEAFCLKLINAEPDIDYYLELGKLYNRNGMRDRAIEVYNEALSFQPNNTDLLNALALTYLKKALDSEGYGNRRFRLSNSYSNPFVKDTRDLDTSESIYQDVLAQDPNNIEALAGLGRISIANDNQRESESYFDEALNIDPSDATTLTYLAVLRSRQKRYFSAGNIYRYLLEVDPTDEDSRIALANNDCYTKPSVSFGGFYTEENEKSGSPSRWIARLKDYGEILKVIYPVNDSLKISSAVVNESINLKQLINHSRIYSISARRAFFNASWNDGYYTTTYGGFGLTNYGRLHKANFRTKHELLFLPNLGVTYNRHHHSLIAETNADAVIVDRNFKNNTAKLITRQFLRGFYQYDFGKGVLTGIEAANIWFFDRLHNQERRVSGWLQWSPSKAWKNISLRYFVDYRTFKDLTLSYYTYRNQVTNWAQLQLYESWKDDTIFVRALYSHGWQRSFETGELITISPAPFHWLSRRINTVLAEVGTRCNGWNFSLTGLYYHDNFQYTVGSVKGSVTLEF